VPSILYSFVFIDDAQSDLPRLQSYGKVIRNGTEKIVRRHRTSDLYAQCLLGRTVADLNHFRDWYTEAGIRTGSLFNK